MENDQNKEAVPSRFKKLTKILGPFGVVAVLVFNFGTKLKFLALPLIKFFPILLKTGGTMVTSGLPHPSRQFAVSALSIVGEEKTIMGSYMGSSVPSRDIPRYIELSQSGQLPVDLLISGFIELEQINEGFDALDQGRVIRQIVRF